MIGKAISHDGIIEKLGEGRLGTVYKTENTRLKRPVILSFSLIISDFELRKFL